MRKNRVHHEERGQVIMVVALLLPCLLGMAAMAIDLGSYAADRRTLQNAADAIALAAAQDLPDESAATASAQTAAAANDIDISKMTLTFTSLSSGAANPKVRVRIVMSHEFSFMRVLGVEKSNVSAAAAGIKASYGGSSGIVPWTVTQDTVDAAGNGSLVTLKYDSDGAENGNFGAIRIDGNGASTYENSVKYGSSHYACAETAPQCTPGACPGTYPTGCAETAPECDGAECEPQTGNMVGPTQRGVDYRMENASGDCDSFDDAFDGPAGGKYHINPICNPWLTSGSGGTRVIIIPVVDGFGNGGSDDATIQRFALLYLEGYDDGKCSGNACEIKGRFVRADLSARALSGAYDEDASVHFAKLSE